MAVASWVSSSAWSNIPDIVLCMVSTMVRRLRMVSICGGSSATSWGTTASTLSTSLLSSPSFSLSLSTPSVALYADRIPQQMGTL